MCEKMRPSTQARLNYFHTTVCCLLRHTYQNIIIKSHHTLSTSYKIDKNYMNFEPIEPGKRYKHTHTSYIFVLVMANQLNEEQIALFQEVFSMYDADDDGTINTADLGSVLKCLGMNLTKEELEKLTNEVDSGAFGMVNFQQFLVMMANHLKESNIEEQRYEAFRMFDVDGKGFITASDLKQIMINLGEKLMDRDISAMMKEADINKDGQVSYDEFIRIVTSKP